jgi:hypothetical protein
MAREGSNPSTRSDVDQLYALPPEEFVPARDRLAKALRDDGKDEEAKRIKALRRPTVPAWVINQVVRTQHDGVEELLASGEDLRRAQQRALSGRGGGELREAGERRRTAIQALTEAAEAVLEEAGRSSPGHLEAIRTTFEAASIDQDAAGQVREGRLVKELDAPAGFGDIAGLALVPDPEAGPGAKAGKGKRDADLKAQRQAEKAKRETQEAKADAERLEREARSAERRAVKAEQEAAQARSEAARLRKQAGEARKKFGRHSRA